MWETYKRWRHTRGYGIHSPFAYCVVTHVISQPCAYYGYDDIAAELEHIRRARLTERLCRLILRLSNFLQPKSIYCPAGTPSVIPYSCRLGCSSAAILSEVKEILKADFIVDLTASIDDFQLSELLARDGTTLLLLNVPRNRVNFVAQNLQYGLILYSTSRMLVFVRKKLPIIKYSINLF
ncbi:MAG: hypothetical protein NC201_04815 [Prevotella sp.]|nr:hypothetical protein [Bacteroides sp.]MCM1366551.1 hypothetical protein [Prevotella sp.]MCM1436861.1 hypothetical protein [Prevotella sp.]